MSANPTRPTPQRTDADGWTGHDYIEDEDVAPEPRWKMIDKHHSIVGRAVVYTGKHPNAKREQGIVTSVNVAANIVFVRYGKGSTSAATSVDDRLTFLDGAPVILQ